MNLSKVCPNPDCDHSHCSDLCQQEYWIQKRREKNFQKRLDNILFVYQIVSCEVCGKLFLQRKITNKYCEPKCSHIALRHRNRKAA